MRFSIITPTLQRMSLLETCHSLNDQTFADWQHIISVDGVIQDWWLESVDDIRRRVISGPESHNFGNRPRHDAYKEAHGEYLIYLDDDNYFAYPNALRDIDFALASANEPDWAIFPIVRFGQRFYEPDPGLCKTDSANMVIKREIGQWPDGPEYTMDGILAERLKEKYEYAQFPFFRPIISVPIMSKGEI